MAEYIEREALIEDCKRMIAETWNSRTAPVSWAHAYADFLDILEYIPAADVSPVVHCKDCKHMEISEETNGRYCHVWGFFNGAGDDGFCNYGERKEGT